MNTADWKALEARHYMRTFNRLPAVLDHGEGVRVWDTDGKCYLDLVAGIAVNALGHNHPKLVKAISEQAAKLIHVSNLYYSIPQLELAKLICENSAGDRVFFGNSGAEANEGAIKLARKWGKTKKDGAYEIVTVSGAFHGRTIATLDATGNKKYMQDFTPMPGGFVHVPFNDVEALERAVGPKTAAVMLEVVQGESGVHLATSEFLRMARHLCDEHNALLVLDEVQTGIGRTGSFLGYEQYGIAPDVFTLAKALAGGVPIGAVVATERAAIFTPGDHGSTFGGNPLACAAGVAVVRTVLEDGILENVKTVGAYFLGKLEELVAKHEVAARARGRGLMLALDLTAEIAPQVQGQAFAKGLIVNATGPTTLRMVPPLILTQADVDEAITILDAVLAESEVKVA